MNSMWKNNYLYGCYRNEKFGDIFNTYTDFYTDYTTCGLPTNIRHADPVSPSTDENSLKTLYLLLAGRYMNSTIASESIDQFKLKLFGIIYQYGPTWERELDLQKKIRELTDDEITGSSVRYYKGYNPTGEFAIGEDVDFVNEQNTQLYQKNKGEAFGIADALLKNDITSRFLDKFKKLFITIVNPEIPLIYPEEDE